MREKGSKRKNFARFFIFSLKGRLFPGEGYSSLFPPAGPLGYFLFCAFLGGAVRGRK